MGEKKDSSERAKNHQIWLDDNGSEKMYSFQGIDENSCVFDIGLYKGLWAEQICSRYGPTLYGFEPIWDYFRIARNRLSSYSSKVRLFNCGVGGSTRSEDIALLGDSSSIFRLHDKKQRITIRSMKEILEDLNVKSVDLAEINIEGGEYELLEFMISTGLIERFKQLLIQFHRIGPDYSNRKKKIQEALSKTHTLLYRYEYIFEHWHI